LGKQKKNAKATSAGIQHGNIFLENWILHVLIINYVHWYCGCEMVTRV
jgi:hypothetical protein